MDYRGWEIFYFPRGAQHWRAEQHGVGMCASSKDALKRMIDAKMVK